MIDDWDEENTTEDWDDEETEQFFEVCVSGLLQAPEYVRKMAALRLIGSTLNDLSLIDACEEAIKHKKEEDQEYLEKVMHLDDYRGEH